jgi:hypothetical protein
MKKCVGLWLDHKRAVVVTLNRNQEPFSGNRDMVEFIESRIERTLRLSGGSQSRKKPYGPQEIAVDGKPEDRRKRQLRKYYGEIKRRLKDADGIFLFGPGEAKLELKKEVEKTKELINRINAVETTDKMTDRQIIARVKAFFKA